MAPFRRKRHHRSLTRYSTVGAYLIIFFVFLLPPSLAYIPKLDDTCKNRCDKHRPRGYKFPYKLDCNQVSDSMTCITECTACSTICDPKTKIFSCPSTSLWKHPKCREDVCEKRTKGSVRHCKRDSVGTLTDDCDSFCKSCPDWVCNKQSGDNSMYACPFDESSYGSHICKRNCEIMLIEKHGNDVSTPFQFRCTELQHPEDEQCRSDCRDKGCPKSVCDPNKDVDQYNCPSRQSERPFPARTSSGPLVIPEPDKKMGSKCTKLCEEFHEYGGSEKFELDCSTLFETPDEQHSCREGCLHCPAGMCYSNFTSGVFKLSCPGREGEPGGVKSAGNWLTRTALPVFAPILAILIFCPLIIWGCVICRRRRKLKRAAELAAMGGEQPPAMSAAQMNAIRGSMAYNLMMGNMPGSEGDGYGESSTPSNKRKSVVWAANQVSQFDTDDFDDLFEEGASTDMAGGQTGTSGNEDEDKWSSQANKSGAGAGGDKSDLNKGKGGGASGGGNNSGIKGVGTAGKGGKGAGGSGSDIGKGGTGGKGTGGKGDGTSWADGSASSSTAVSTTGDSGTDGGGSAWWKPSTWFSSSQNEVNNSASGGVSSSQMDDSWSKGGKGNATLGSEDEDKLKNMGRKGGGGGGGRGNAGASSTSLGQKKPWWKPSGWFSSADEDENQGAGGREKGGGKGAFGGKKGAQADGTWNDGKYHSTFGAEDEDTSKFKGRKKNMTGDQDAGEGSRGTGNKRSSWWSPASWGKGGNAVGDGSNLGGDKRTENMDDSWNKKGGKFHATLGADEEDDLMHMGGKKNKSGAGTPAKSASWWQPAWWKKGDDDGENEGGAGGKGGSAAGKGGGRGAGKKGAGQTGDSWGKHNDPNYVNLDDDDDYNPAYGSGKKGASGGNQAAGGSKSDDKGSWWKPAWFSSKDDDGLQGKGTKGKKNAAGMDDSWHSKTDKLHGHLGSDEEDMLAHIGERKGAAGGNPSHGPGHPGDRHGAHHPPPPPEKGSWWKPSSWWNKEGANKNKAAGTSAPAVSAGRKSTVRIDDSWDQDEPRFNMGGGHDPNKMQKYSGRKSVSSVHGGDLVGGKSASSISSAPSGRKSVGGGMHLEEKVIGGHGVVEKFDESWNKNDHFHVNVGHNLEDTLKQIGRKSMTLGHGHGEHGHPDHPHGSHPHHTESAHGRKSVAGITALYSGDDHQGGKMKYEGLDDKPEKVHVPKVAESADKKAWSMMRSPSIGAGQAAANMAGRPSVGAGGPQKKNVVGASAGSHVEGKTVGGKGVLETFDDSWNKGGGADRVSLGGLENKLKKMGTSKGTSTTQGRKSARNKSVVSLGPKKER